MRGCLSVIVIAALFIFGAIWFGGPPLAGTVVQAMRAGEPGAAIVSTADVDKVMAGLKELTGGK